MKITYEIYSKRGSFSGLNTTTSMQKMAEIKAMLEANGQACTIVKISEEAWWPSNLSATPLTAGHRQTTHGTTARYTKAHYAETALSHSTNANMRRSTTNETNKARQTTAFCLNTNNSYEWRLVLHHAPQSLWQLPHHSGRQGMRPN